MLPSPYHSAYRMFLPTSFMLIATCEVLLPFQEASLLPLSTLAGGLLVGGGLLWFLVTGSVNAIRFGVLYGGMLLAVAVGSLKAWQAGKSSTPYIFGQAGEERRKRSRVARERIT